MLHTLGNATYNTDKRVRRPLSTPTSRPGFSQADSQCRRSSNPRRAERPWLRDTGAVGARSSLTEPECACDRSRAYSWAIAGNHRLWGVAAREVTAPML